MTTRSAELRRLFAAARLVDMPVATDPLFGRLIESLGFPTVYSGGFATGGTRAVSEPLLTMDEQLRTAGDIAKAVAVPVVADAGAGFGEPLHTMRTVREFIHAGVAGIHIEDQLYPKRAHYHKYVAHVIPQQEFVDKIRYACHERDAKDRDFVIIARSDSCRFLGLEEAVARINLAAEAGADLGMIFPRNPEEMAAAPKLAKLPLVYVRSFGNRDNRPTPSSPVLAEMGYKACIDALLQLVVGFHYAKRALAELKETGNFTGLSGDEMVAARQDIETLISLDRFYEIEEATVEDQKWGPR
jgi:2-methylisocitrate lyase-like PEP mutase family enzyme